MDIKEVRLKLAQLERNTRDLFQKFEEETDCSVTDVRLDRVANYGGQERVIWVRLNAIIPPNRTTN